MCGRFAQYNGLETLISHFGIRKVTCPVTPRYNIAPAQEILAVIQKTERRMGLLKWGFVPAWAENASGAGRMINARLETAAEKPSFREALAWRRCLIPASGYFEWKRDGKRRTPFYFFLKGERPMGMAGIWETWRSGDGGVLHSCAILTSEAAGRVREIHDRMPVILRPEAFDSWLYPDHQAASGLSRRIFGERMLELEIRPVSDRVNSVKNDVPDCVAPLPSGDGLSENELHRAAGRR